ncbi:MAG: SapC family protein [Acidiferrobacterales bacterium]|nr:SapC family protein [Acidiferrobacterales bacterium]
MAELVELSPEAHGDLKLDPLAALGIAKRTHIMSLRVTEISRAACEVPVFLTKSGQDGSWLISSITSLEVEKNLFVRDDKWQGLYQPSGMATYPFFLMRHPKEENQFTIGIDPEHDAFKAEDGVRLFEDDKKAGMHLSRVTQILQEDMRNDVHTHQFCKYISDLGLIRALDVVVAYEGGKVNTLKGLSTIDEEKLAGLSEEQFKELREKNYLAPLYSLLISLYQLNHLIRLHNDQEGVERITQVSMGAEKDENAAA